MTVHKLSRNIQCVGGNENKISLLQPGEANAKSLNHALDSGKMGKFILKEYS